MSDQTNVFNDVDTSNQQQAAPQQQALSSDASYADLLKSIKNENGEQKYDSLPKALEGLANAQQYIPQLKTTLQQKEAELEELRNKLAQQANIEDVVSRLTAKQSQTQVEQPLQASGLDEQAVLQLLERNIAQREAQAQATTNTQKVQEALMSKYGDKTSEVVAARAKALGTTPQELGNLAAKNPSMVLELFNTQASKGPTPTVSSLNTSSFQGKPETDLQRPDKSLLGGIGATDKQRKEFMRQIKERVYARHGITQ